MFVFELLEGIAVHDLKDLYIRLPTQQRELTFKKIIFYIFMYSETKMEYLKLKCTNQTKNENGLPLY